MAVGIYIVLLILINVQFSSQKPEAVTSLENSDPAKRVFNERSANQKNPCELILDGWTPQYTNSVFKAFHKKLNWTNAMSACRSFGGFLAEIQSEDEMNIVNRLAAGLP